jgi:hypothetical protein
LEIFLSVGCWSRVLQIGFDGFVLLVELGEIGDDVFDDVGVGERVDLGFLLGVGWDSACPSLSAHIQNTSDNRIRASIDTRGNEGKEGRHTQARQCINTINIHRATPANAFSATPSECQGRVDLVLDSN